MKFGSGNMFKKISAMVLTVLFISLCFCNTIALAAVVEKSIITIATIDGITGDSVIVPITIEENPGISAITVSITYNSSALEFEEFINGNVLSKQEMGVVAHPTRNIIRFVTSEVGNKKGNGTLVSLKFKIKDNAEATLHKIDLKYNQGDFCNWKLDKIMPRIIAGGVNVAYNGSNCPHKVYGEWSVAAVPSCEEQGMDSRICENCGHTDLRYNNPIGHEYSDVWTVDQEATPEQDGLMSRHCVRCSNFVDQISFKYEQSEDVDVENSVGNQTNTNDKIEEIFKEQNPDAELTPNIPPTSNEDKNNSSNKNSSDKQQNSANTSSKNPATQNSNTNSSTQSKTESENTSSESSYESSISTDPQSETKPVTDPSTDNNINSDNSQNQKTYIDKITDAFPQFAKIINTFKIFAIILIFIIL